MVTYALFFASAGNKSSMAAYGAKFLSLYAAFTLMAYILTPVNADETAIGEERTGKAPVLRSQKMNLIWEKALKKLVDTNKLNKLLAELRVLDDEYMVLKKALSDDGDPLGEMEASLMSKTEALLHNFDLWEHFDQYDAAVAEKKRLKRENKEASAMDKLDLLLEKAKAAGFTVDELADLRTEVDHHKQKLQEYEQLRTEVELLAHQSNRIPDVEDSTKDESFAGTVFSEVDNKKALLKEKHKEIRHGYEKLKVLSETPVTLKDIDFTNSKLIGLWAEALKANFSNEELQSLKVELSHLQRKMSKHEVLKEQASLVKKELKKGDNVRDEGRSVEALRVASERHDEISSQAEEYGRLVKKYVSDIKNRIKESSWRNEL